MSIVTKVFVNMQEGITLCVTLKHLCLQRSTSYGSCYISLSKTTPFPIQHFFCTLVRETPHLQKVCLHVFSCKKFDFSLLASIICILAITFMSKTKGFHGDLPSLEYTERGGGENNNLLFFCITYFFSEHLFSV